MSQADVKEIADNAVLDVTDAAGGYARNCRHGEGRRTAASPVLDNGSNNLATLRYRLKDVKFDAIEQTAKAGDSDLPAGSLLVENSPRLRGGNRKAGTAGGGHGAGTGGAASMPSTLPRLAVFSTWGSTQDVGWVRYGLRPFRSGVRFDLQGAHRAKAICAPITT